VKDRISILHIFNIIKMTFSAVSLFSGMGGDTLGIHKAGGTVIAYNEFWKVARDTHDLNFPESKLIQDESAPDEKNQTDIQKIPDSKFSCYENIVDLIFAGFPCQGFSHGGLKKNNDPRNTLFIEFIRTTNQIRPKYIIGENVTGLLSRKTTTNELYIDVIKSEFERIGYNISYKICSSHRFGVPQKRKRLIIVGIRDDVVQDFEFPEGNDIELGLTSIIKFDMKGAIKIESDDFDMTQIPETSILTDMNNTEIENNPHPYLKLKAKTRGAVYNKKIFATLLSFAKRDSPIHAEIIDLTKPAKTIICSYDHQPRLFVALRNNNGYYLRCILPDELKQIQGFPPDYQLTGSYKDKIKQIGNSVPPPFIEAIVRSLVINHN
jgi:DNA (cytosine-5)-methyltransferase 1